MIERINLPHLRNEIALYHAEDAKFEPVRRDELLALIDTVEAVHDFAGHNPSVDPDIGTAERLALALARFDFEER